MENIRAIPRYIVAGISLLAVSAFAGSLLADAGGRTGRSQSSTGCSCHSSTATAGVSVAITGPQFVAPLSTHEYTVSVSGGTAGTKGGFDLKASAGTLVAGTGARVAGLEVVHSNSNNRTWTFQWTAPATLGTENFYAIAMTADGDDSDNSADTWNFFGGVVNTPFAITVTNQLGVDSPDAVTWLAPVAPNPCRTQATVTWSLAASARVDLGVFDLAGRQIATLARGLYPAGRNSITWDRRGSKGVQVEEGVYFVRLRTLRADLVKPVVIIQ